MKRLAPLILIVIFMQVSANVFAQKISLSGKGATIKSMLNDISRQSGYNVVYNEQVLKLTTPVNIQVNNAELIDVLNKLFEGQPAGYVIYNRAIIVKPKTEKQDIQDLRSVPLNDAAGYVVDEQGKLIEGASISLKRTKKAVRTDETGMFMIKGVMDNDVLIISCIGYKTLEITLFQSQVGFRVVLEIEERSMKEVVITGMYERKKESFSGSSASFSGQQLRDVGNQNVIQSLKTLDPSFVVLDNALNGSNPNALGNIEVRGKTSVNSKRNDFGVLTDQIASDPNQPLFILDGFEATLRQVTDLDMNRIASLTILKDAASTALYGSRSANGVIVIETIKPKAGALTFNYSANTTVDVADLSSYNLMNAEQKLEFERLAGRYGNGNSASSGTLDAQRLYNERLKRVKQGVNTYWLNVPLRTGFTQKHSIYTNGGSESFQFGAGIDYQDINGVMKGSGRKNWGGRADMNYRTGNLNISNRIYINGFKSKESPFGSFKDYAQLNPYYPKDYADKYFERGTVSASAYEGGGITESRNPLYNAALNSFNYKKQTNIQNNLAFNWDVNFAFRISGGLQLSKIFGSRVDFVSPENTKFDGLPALQKGSYVKVDEEKLSYDGNLMLSYNKVFNEKHVVTVNLRGDIRNEEGSATGFSAQGFPQGVPGNPVFAHSYQTNSKPIVEMSATSRKLNGLISTNYVYDNRYFVDATLRRDGSTAFGTFNRYSTFWSVGAGWSLKNEAFLENADWLNMLTLRANTGSTGNQQLGSFASTTIYELENNTNLFGQSLYHSGLGNPGLKWQKTQQSNLGLDFSLLNNRLSGTFNGYEKFTDPLIVNIDLPGSNGVANYPINVGNLTVRGFEASLRYAVINNIAARTLWTIGLTGQTYKSNYGGFDKRLEGLNELQKKSRSIIRYRDGYSPDDIWAVPSLGIDPGTGEEMFLKKDGSHTFDYDPEDARVVGSLRPKAEGILSSSLRLKGLILSVALRYSLGASIINSALYEKVENISLPSLAYNQDLRALQDRWKQPGDRSQFKGIGLTSRTEMSSRFVQKENVITGESFSAGYEFQSRTSPWLNRFGFRSLRFTAFMNNMFRISNITTERGLDYPFANSVSFSLNASF
ncbi:SusC/RagA family TonB-linked outer membrane protein [Pedobacter steynii]|uniref:SusC/RagA family TonB-linked outer membrane protein n=1 Tax=Pedobacter steynii TaxID=430522 RepID=UPI00155D9621|nr:SusC/RagA family TonB-linked outer membrane protein [Pedobacter steynii]NQX39181.1 SusC/RagA family TonB-linked outer membrane protein [Pedobacter steynii]